MFIGMIGRFHHLHRLQAILIALRLLTVIVMPASTGGIADSLESLVAMLLSEFPQPEDGLCQRVGIDHLVVAVHHVPEDHELCLDAVLDGWIIQGALITGRRLRQVVLFEVLIARRAVAVPVGHTRLGTANERYQP